MRKRKEEERIYMRVGKGEGIDFFCVDKVVLTELVPNGEGLERRLGDGFGW